MPINCKGINTSGIHIPKSGIKYNQFIIVIRGEPIRIKWFTDNQNVVSIVSNGSTKTVLQELALDIFSACLKFNVNIDMVSIPRSENDRADYLRSSFHVELFPFSESSHIP
jgi:hypothetical protein